VTRYLDDKVTKEEKDVLTATVGIDGDLGLLSREQFLAEIAKAVKTTPDEVEAELKNLCSLHHSLISLIEQIREFADVALLSNACYGHAEMILDGLNTRRLFDKVFISCYHGIAKPDPRFYRLCIDSFDKEYNEIYMVDDSDKNLAPLTDLGIIPVKYTCSQDVEKALQKYLEKK
jgi:putative hydrolase of the HAD superfamily